MTDGDFLSSAYVSELNTAQNITLKVMRNEFSKFLLNVLNPELWQYDKESGLINSTEFSFFFRFQNYDNKWLLTFFPYGTDVTRWTKAKNIDAIKSTIDLCNDLGQQFRISFFSGVVEFHRMSIGQQCLDSSNWKVAIPQGPMQTKDTLQNILQLKNHELRGLIKNKCKFNLFYSQYVSPKLIDSFKQLLLPYGSIDIVADIDQSRTILEKRMRVKNEINIFIDDDFDSSDYTLLKKHFLINGIPTQFVSVDTIKNKFLKFPGPLTNFYFEMFTKMNDPPLTLSGDGSIKKSEGFLCLSDIQSTKNPLFGALVTYTDGSMSKTEELHIYPDINIDENRDTFIDIDEDVISSLALKISSLVGKNSKLDIIITKKWKIEKLELLVERLKEVGIEIYRVFYISSKTNRFVDLSILNDNSKMHHYYSIISNNIAFLKLATDVRIYAHLPMMYIEKMLPITEPVTTSDLLDFIWLTKKRTYRIAEYSVLCNPEPIHIFHRAKEMNIENIQGRMVIPIHLLI